MTPRDPLDLRGWKTTWTQEQLRNTPLGSMRYSHGAFSYKTGRAGDGWTKIPHAPPRPRLTCEIMAPVAWKPGERLFVASIVAAIFVVIAMIAAITFGRREQTSKDRWDALPHKTWYAPAPASALALGLALSGCRTTTAPTARWVLYDAREHAYVMDTCAGGAVTPDRDRATYYRSPGAAWRALDAADIPRTDLVVVEVP